MTALPETSVVIATRDRPALLLATVESILAGEERPAEIVVVDQGAPPADLLGRLPAAAAGRVRHVPHAGRGLSVARNVGLRAARHPLVVIVDDDMLVAPDWLGTLARALAAAGPATVVTGRVLAAPVDVPGGFVPALATSPEPAIYRGVLDRDVLAGGHMAAFAATLHAVGGFDERLGAGTRYPSAEDNDLGFRLLVTGHEIRYVPEAVVWHRAWRPAADRLRVRWGYGRGKGGFYAKHLPRHRAYVARRVGRDAVRRVVRWPRYLVRGRWDYLSHDAVYLAGVACGGARWLLEARSAEPHRAPDAAAEVLEAEPRLVREEHAERRARDREGAA